MNHITSTVFHAQKKIRKEKLQGTGSFYQLAYEKSIATSLLALFFMSQYLISSS